MKDKKKIVIGALCALIMIMAVGYALLAQTLSITGSASITSNWQVEITNITEKEKSTGATTNNTNYTATTASFNTTLTSPGDYALYEVTVTNKGTLDAVLAAKPTVTTGNNEAIQYELEGIQKGDKILKNNQTDTFTIKVQYNSSSTTQPSNLTSNIEVILNYEQDLGQVVVYDTYSIGDKVTFAGSDWYVIKDSTNDEDYVTIMKATSLMNLEGLNYENTMAYNWTLECHAAATYYNIYANPTVYNSADTRKCSVYGHYLNIYEESKIKYALDRYINHDLEEEKLKEIEGYKIRLIRKEEAEELKNISNAAEWVYGEQIGGYGSYWTMTAVYSHEVYIVNKYGDIENVKMYSLNNSVRPVINLYKSAIE